VYHTLSINLSVSGGCGVPLMGAVICAGEWFNSIESHMRV